MLDILATPLIDERVSLTGSHVHFIVWRNYFFALQIASIGQGSVMKNRPYYISLGLSRRKLGASSLL